MMMKRLIYLCCGTLALCACGNNLEKKANEKLEAARTAYQLGDYETAKQQIDSIKILYPKAFEARKAGQALLMEVETKAQEKMLARLDSVLRAVNQEVEAQVKEFTLEKDAEYQQVGNYLWPTQTVEKNLRRSFLRFQVNELGVMSMTSIYCGKGNIHHTAVRVTAPDKSSAQTPASKDSYETEDLGVHIEKADYKLGEDGGVIAFIALNQDKNLRVEFLGDRTYTTTMLPADREAAAKVYGLAKLLSEVQEIKKRQEESRRKIMFIEKKREHEEQSPS